MHKLFELLQPYEQRVEIRNSRAFKNFLEPWNSGAYNRVSKVGPVMGSIKDMMSENSEADRVDWNRFYVSRVRTPDQILALTTVMAQKESLDLAISVNWWWIHVLDSSWTGFEDERFCYELVKLYAESKGLAVRYSTAFEDKNWGIDLVVFDPKTGEIIVGIQIKPYSYFIGRSPDNMNAREVYNKAKYRKFTEACNAPVWYMDATNSRKRNAIVWWKAEY